MDANPPRLIVYRTLDALLVVPKELHAAKIVVRNKKVR
jgi:hypothetical protein